MLSNKEKPEKDAGEPVNMSLNNHGYAEAGNSFGPSRGYHLHGDSLQRADAHQVRLRLRVIQARIVPQFLPTLPTSTPTHHGKSAASPKVRATTKMRPHMI